MESVFSSCFILLIPVFLCLPVQVVVERYTKTDLADLEKKKLIVSSTIFFHQFLSCKPFLMFPIYFPFRRYLVPRDMSIGQFIHVLSSRLHLQPGKALFVFVKNTLPPTCNFFMVLVQLFFIRIVLVGRTCYLVWICNVSSYFLQAASWTPSMNLSRTRMGFYTCATVLRKHLDSKTCSFLRWVQCIVLVIQQCSGMHHARVKKFLLVCREISLFILCKFIARLKKTHVTYWSNGDGFFPTFIWANSLSWLHLFSFYFLCVRCLSNIKWTHEKFVSNQQPCKIC